jgi:hypothetical protein
MRKIELTLFAFHELSVQAKEKARKWYRNGALDYDWWSFTYDDAEYIGLILSGFDLDRNRHANGHFNLSACEVAQNIFNNHGEHCRTYETAKQFMDDWQPIYNKYMDVDDEMYESLDAESDMLELEFEFLNSLLEDYSIMLQNEYEHLLSDKIVDETIIINEYEFLEDGTKY